MSNTRRIKRRHLATPPDVALAEAHCNNCGAVIVVPRDAAVRQFVGESGLYCERCFDKAPR